MKKLLSFVLAVIMIISCCMSTVGAVRTGNETTNETMYYDNDKNIVYTVDGVAQTIDLPKRYTYESKATLDGEEYINKLISDGVEIFGVSVDYLYNNKSSTFLWKNVTSYSNRVDAEGNLVDIESSDISLTIGNINMYLLRLLKSLYSDFRFYTDKNAVACINFIGNLINSAFIPLAADTIIFKDSEYIYNSAGIYYADEDIFFQKVADMSGLSVVIQENWVERRAFVDFIPTLRLLGVAEDNLLPSEYYEGDTIARVLLKSIYVKVMGEGPIKIFTDILKAYADVYEVKYYDAVEALFSQKLGTSISPDQLKTFSGLLNLIFNDNNKYDTNKFQFAPLPQRKLALATTDAEIYLYLIMYANINAHYKNNAQVISNAKVDIDYSDVITLQEDRDRLKQMIDIFTGENIEDYFFSDTLGELTTENLTEKPGEIWGGIKEYLTRFVKRIADWFQMWFRIFTGEEDFLGGAM